MTDPQTLGLPFGDRTYDRLAAYANEVAGVAIGRSRIQELPVAEGLRWRRQETWFGKRVDSDFAAKTVAPDGKAGGGAVRSPARGSTTGRGGFNRLEPRRSHGVGASPVRALLVF